MESSSILRSWVIFVILALLKSVSSLRWTKEPSNRTEVLNGSRAVLRWHYNLEGATFRYLQWIDDETSTLIAERDSESGKPFIDNKYPGYPRFNVDKDEMATLVIDSVNFSDEGKYRCELKGDVGISRPLIISKVELRVVVAPQITYLQPKNKVVNESDPVTFTCFASGDPKPNVMWIKDGRNISSGANLTFLRATEDDAGVYNCTAYNSNVAPSATASVHLKVQYLRKPILSESGSVIVYINNSMSVKCFARGVPTPEVFWKDNKGEKYNGDLLTKKLKGEEDGGTYTCFAKNILGEKNVSVSLIVTEPPEDQYPYQIEFKIINILYTKKYSDMDSVESRNLSKRIKPQLQVVYGNRGIKILKFSEGSVKVLFQVTYDKPVPESEVLAPLKGAVQNGSFGDGLEVELASIKLISGRGTGGCLLEPCVYGTCKDLGNGYKCSCDSLWKGTNCDDPVLIIVLAVVIPVVVVMVVFLLCFWHKRNQKCRRDCRVKDDNMKVSYANDGPQPEGEYATVQSTKAPRTDEQYESLNSRKKQPQQSTTRDQYAVAQKTKKTKKPAQEELNYVAVSTGSRQPGLAAPAKPLRQETTYADIAFRNDDML